MYMCVYMYKAYECICPYVRKYECFYVFSHTVLAMTALALYQANFFQHLSAVGLLASCFACPL